MSPATIAATPTSVALDSGPTKNIDKAILHPKVTEIAAFPQGQNENVHTLDEVLIERCRYMPNEPMIGYPRAPTSADQYIYYTAADIDRYVNGTIQDLERQGLARQKSLTPEGKNHVVGVLGPSNLDYVITLFALSRLGYAVFFLSTRLSAQAYVSLLAETGCHHIVHARLPPVQKSVSEILSLQKNIQQFELPDASTYMRHPHSSVYTLKSTAEASARIGFIIHSSGSTGLPKPIFNTHKSALDNYRVSKVFESYFLTLPLYHGHGISTFFRAMLKGKSIALYNAALPLTGGNIVKALRSVDAESIHCVPYALKLLAETKGGIDILARSKQVLFGGSSCPDELGDKLVQGGVRLISHYGATEMGQLMTSDRPVNDNGWNFVRPLPHAAPYLLFDPLEDGTFECVVLDGLPSKVQSNSDEPPNSYRTHDCFVKHDSLPDCYKYVGRLDDRVNLINGEKVLPIPIEHRIRQNKLVKDVLVVGVGRDLPGLIVMPSTDAEGLDKTQLSENLWPDIAAANSVAEAFSQISKDLIEILPVNTWYPATDKGTLIRKACYKHFEKVIDEMYDRAAGTSVSPDAMAGTKLALDISGIENFLSGVIKRELALKDVEPTTDLFTAGMDSLQAIKGHGLVKRHLDLGTGRLGQNAFFDYGNIKDLATHIYRLRQGEQDETDNDISSMTEFVEKYSDFQKRSLDDSQVLLLTGVTGSLGCYILHNLLSRQSVKKVYCLVRAASANDALDRVVSSLSNRELPLTNLSKIRALPSDLSSPSLGLTPELIDELRYSLTKVIHSAWAVNFNIGIRSFEQQHIAGVRNLINLCLSSYQRSPAEFYFCSSTSTAAGTPLPASISETPVPELFHAHGMGYAKSKLVAERIVQAAAEKTGMVSKVLRVGQIVGDTAKGRWNQEEAIPLMIQSATTLGVLPALAETPSWTPVDVVAQAVLELSAIEPPEDDKRILAAQNRRDPTVIYHVLNSSVFHWTEDLLPALRDAGLVFETVGQREWIKRLREGEQEPRKNPTVKLVDFFAGKYDNDGSRQGLSYQSHKTEEVCPALRGGVELISSGLIKKFVDSWRRGWAQTEEKAQCC